MTPALWSSEPATTANTGVRCCMRPADLSGEPDAGRLFGHLGPDVLGPDWDAAEAAGRLATSGATIGSALLDQSNLAGVGTLYASETLFIERLSPWSPVASLVDVQIRQVVDRVHQLLDINRHNATQSTTGLQGHGRTTFVHGRSGRPCRRCGQTVRVSILGVPPQDRAFFYCPTCQGGLAPGDQGRSQGPLGSSARSPGRRRLG